MSGCGCAWQSCCSIGRGAGCGFAWVWVRVWVISCYPFGVSWSGRYSFSLPPLGISYIECYSCWLPLQAQKMTHYFPTHAQLLRKCPRQGVSLAAWVDAYGGTTALAQHMGLKELTKQASMVYSIGLVVFYLSSVSLSHIISCCLAWPGSLACLHSRIAASPRSA